MFAYASGVQKASWHLNRVFPLQLCTFNFNEFYVAQAALQIGDDACISSYTCAGSSNMRTALQNDSLNESGIIHVANLKA